MKDKHCSNCKSAIVMEPEIPEVLQVIVTTAIWLDEEKDQPAVANKYFCGVDCLLNFYHGVEDGQVEWQ